MNFNFAIALTSLLASTASCAFTLTCSTTSNAVREQFTRDTNIFLNNVNEIWGCGRKYLQGANQDQWVYHYCINNLGLPEIFNTEALNMTPENFSNETEFRRKVDFMGYYKCQMLNQQLDIPEEVIVSGGEFNRNHMAPDYSVKDVWEGYVRMGWLRKIRVPGSPDDNPEYEYERI